MFRVRKSKKEREQEVRTNDSTRTFIWKTHVQTLRKRDQAQAKPVFLKSVQKLNHYRFWFSQAIFKGTVALPKCSRLNLMLLHVQLVSTFVCLLLSKRFRTRIQCAEYNAFQCPAVSFTCFISFSLHFLSILAKTFNSSDTYTCLVFVLHCIAIKDA